MSGEVTSNDLIQRARSPYNPRQGDGLDITEDWGQEDANILFIGSDDPEYGNDRIHINTDYGGFVSGGEGNDELTMEGSQADGAEANLGLYGGGGNDILTSLFNNAVGILELFGGQGDDTTNFTGSGNTNVLAEMLHGNNTFLLHSGSHNNVIDVLLGLGRNFFRTGENTSGNTVKFMGEYAADGAGPLEGTGLGTAEDKAMLRGTGNTFRGHTSDGDDHLQVTGSDHRFDLSLGHGADDITFEGTDHAGRINLNRVAENGDIVDDKQADVLDLSQSSGFTLSVAAGENDTIRLSEGGWSEAERGVDENGRTIESSETAKIYKKTEPDGSVSTLIVYNISGDGADPVIEGAGDIAVAGVADIEAERASVTEVRDNREARANNGAGNLPQDESTDAAAIPVSIEDPAPIEEPGEEEELPVEEPVTEEVPVEDPAVEDPAVDTSARTQESDVAAFQMLSQLASTEHANTGGLEDYAWDSAEIDGLITLIENDQLPDDIREDWEFYYMPEGMTWEEFKPQLIASLRYAQVHMETISHLGTGSEVVEASGKISDMDARSTLGLIFNHIAPDDVLTLEQVINGER